MAYELPRGSDFSPLKMFLCCDRNPRSVMVLSVLDHLENGRMEGSVFTDNWPNVQAVLVMFDAGNIQQIVFGGEQSVKVVEMMSCAGVADCNSDLIIIGINFTIAEEVISKAASASPPLVLHIMSTIHLYVMEGDLINLDRSLPAEYSLQPLKSSDLPLVASKWTYAPLHKSLTKFTKCMEVDNSVGVYKRMENGEQQLVSWAMQHQRGSIAHLYTLEEYRRRGLALAVVYELCKRLKAKGEIPIAEVDAMNQPSNAFFQKLGFKIDEECLAYLYKLHKVCKIVM